MLSPSDEFIDELTIQLNSAGANTYVCTFDENTGLLTIETSIPDTIKFISLDEKYGIIPATNFQSTVIADRPLILNGFDAYICIKSALLIIIIYKYVGIFK